MGEIFIDMNKKWMRKFKWVIIRREEYENLKNDLYKSECNAEGIWQLRIFEVAGLKNKIAELKEENERLKKEISMLDN